MVRFLLRYGARVDVSSQAGYTPLHIAAQNGDGEIVGILLDAGASPNAVTVDGQTALAIARRLGYIRELDALRYVTDSKLIAEAASFIGEYKRQAPEAMQEAYASDSEDGSKLML